MINRMISSIAGAVIVLAASSAPAALLYSTDFETSQSGYFTVQNGAGDFVANFNYDYNTWVPQVGDTPSSIPAALSAPGKKGLRLEANNNDATPAFDAVTVFPTSGTAGLSNYSMKFDAWCEYNGASRGAGVGETQYVVVGGHSPGTSAAWVTATAFSGFFWSASSDGDEATSYRYYEGTGGTPVENDAKPNWFGSNQSATSSPGWVALLPSPTYESAGNISKAWVTIEQIAMGSSIQIYITPTGGVRTLVADFTTSLATNSGRPFVGLWDPFVSIANPAADQFLIIDNFSVSSIPIPTAAQDWQYLQ